MDEVTAHILEALCGDAQRRTRPLRILASNAPGTLQAVSLALLGRGREDSLTRALLALLESRGLLDGTLLELRKTDPGAAVCAAHLAEMLAWKQPWGAAGSQENCASPVPDDVLQNLAEAASHLLAILYNEIPRAAARSARSRSQLALASARAFGLIEAWEALAGDPDPRVRADALEGLWGQRTEFALSRFRKALSDPHHRVVADAWVGLHIAGDDSAFDGLAGMASHENPLFRAAAAWAMGRTGDPRFQLVLEDLRRRSRTCPSVLLRAAHALTRITPRQGAQALPAHAESLEDPVH